MSSKIGFWTVFALVTGSQIGSGIFMLPAILAPYGGFSFGGWIISSLGAIALSLVFASLCAKFPQTGGPHVYINKAFGPTFAFFTGWTYWIISWVSTTTVIITSISYLSPFIGNQSPIVYLALEISLLAIITFLNLRGLQAAGSIEVVLTFLKFIPLLVMPLAAMYFFDKGNLSVSHKVANLSISQILGQVTLITLWAFIGLESATTPAGSVINPSKTVPRAMVVGTLCVALLYFVNSVGIIGLIQGSKLANSKAPYVDAAQIIFGGNWHLFVSAIASIVCIGTLNAWILTSGQIILGLSADRLMPNFFAKKNSNEVPFWGVIISCLGIVPLLILTVNESHATQITNITDLAVTAFLFVYLICSVAFLKLLIIQQKTNYLQCLLALTAIIFCCWVIYQTPLKTLIVASLFTLSGIPMYLLWYCYKTAPLA